MTRLVWANFVVCVFSILTAWNVYAQERGPSAQTGASVEVPVETASVATELRQQVAILKVQLEDAKRFQEQIVDFHPEVTH